MIEGFFVVCFLKGTINACFQLSNSGQVNTSESVLIWMENEGKDVRISETLVAATTQCIGNLRSLGNLLGNCDVSFLR